MKVINFSNDTEIEKGISQDIKIYIENIDGGRRLHWLLTAGRVGLALAIALVSRWHVRQWQVPKAWVRIFLGCRAVGIVRRVFVRQPSPVLVLFVFFKVPVV